MMTNWKIWIVCGVVGVVVGLGGGWWLWHPKPTPPETYAPPVRQKDSSLVLERKPDATARPDQIIPKGGTVERIVHVTVQPKPVPASSVHATSPPVSATDTGTGPTSGPIAATPPKTSPPATDSLICPPVRVDLSLVRLKDQTRRVIASSPDGQVVGGVDIPVEPIPSTKVLKWAAGGIYNPRDRTYGGFIDRDLGPLRLGVEGIQIQPAPMTTRTWAAQVRLGVRF